MNLSEMEATWLLMHISSNHQLASRTWENNPTRKTGNLTLEPMFQNTKVLLGALEILEEGTWGQPLAAAATASRKPLVELKNRLQAKLAGINSDPTMAAQARLRGARAVSPEMALFARAELLLALAGREPGALRGEKSPILNLVRSLQAMTDGSMKKGYGNRAATPYQKRRDEATDYAEQVRNEARVLMVRCRDALSKGLAPGELWSPESDPARAELVRRLLYAHPPYSTGERVIVWGTTRSHRQGIDLVEQP